jgi:uncharacterized protein with PQ loop repeat
MDWHLTLQVVAVATTMIAWVPQWWLAIRSREPKSISVSAWVQATAIGMTWGLWGAVAHVWSIAGSEGAFAVGALAILVVILDRRDAVFAIAGAAAFAGFVVAFSPIFLLGIAACTMNATTRLSQIIKLHRTHSSEAVSASAWGLLALASGCWAAYGILTGQWPLWLGGFISVVFSVAVALTVYCARTGSNDQSKC